MSRRDRNPGRAGRADRASLSPRRSRAGVTMAFVAVLAAACAGGQSPTPLDVPSDVASGAASSAPGVPTSAPGAPSVVPSSSSVASSSAPASPVPSSPSASITLSSPAVADGALLPAFHCEPKVNGVEASIPLAWSGVPAGARSLAITMEHHPDPADASRVSSYLLLWDIPPTTTSLPAGAAGGGSTAGSGPWHLGANKDGVAVSYTSPCSKGSGTHEYTITLWALAARPASLPSTSTVEVTYPVLMEAIRSVPILATGTLVFTDTTP